MKLSQKQAFIVICILLVACSPKFRTSEVQYQNYQITKAAPVDSVMLHFLAPYKTNMDQTMGKVLGYSKEGLSKQQPESKMGNFMADVMRIEAEKMYHEKVDAAFVNYYGVRAYFAKGNITVGSVFELMPFDNILVLQVLSGKILQQLLDKSAMEGGWPLSGIVMEIKDKKAVNVYIAGKPLEIGANYTVANSDYIANGGGDCGFLKTIPQKNLGVTIRDVLIAHITEMTASGKSIDAKMENRVRAINE
jgi:2',3'-cyclic-nucleotide 2'-phosphodiesterase (5'-nucleotidase family)